MRLLQQLVEQRRALVDDVRRLTNRITDALKQYFPQVLEWFAGQGHRWCSAISSPAGPRSSTPSARVRLALSAFFHEHNVRYPHIIDKRIQAILAATALTSRQRGHRVQSTAGRGPGAAAARAAAGRGSLRSRDRRARPDAARLCPVRLLPGRRAGVRPAPARRLRRAARALSSAAEVQQYAGIAPVTERSGNKSWVHWRLQCPKFLRQTFVEWAALSIPHCYWAKALYDLDAAVAHDVIDVAAQQRPGMERTVQLREDRQVVGTVKTAATERLFDVRDARLGQLDVAAVFVGVEMDPRRQRCHQRSEARHQRDIALDAARDHERDARLVDHQRVGFVHERDVEGPVHEAAGVQGEQVAQVVEAGFLGGDVRDIRP